jgi:hypothetical protein
MLKRLSTALLLGAFLGLVPATAEGAPAAPPADAMQPGSAPAPAYDLNHHEGDDHYRCWYHCDDRYGYRYRRYRSPRYCWYHDRYGWYQARCRDYHRDYSDDDGDYNSHREHDSN